MQQQEIVVEQRLQQNLSDSTSINQSNIPLGSILFVYLSIVFMALFTLLLHPNFKKALLNRILTIKYSRQIPCVNCRYFKNNRYLQCGVHPTIVLSKDAINCADYLPHKNQYLH